MGRRSIFAATVLLAALLLNAETSAQNSVASPAIDSTIFKDGAIDSREFRFEDWYATCQEIVKIKKRVCNLLSTLNNGAGQEAGSVLIATTDAGIPAMLLSFAREVSLEKTIVVESSLITKVDGKAVKIEFKTAVNPMICDATCKYMFPLDPRIVFLLNAREPISVTFLDSKAEDQRKKAKELKTKSNSLALSGRGFAEILSASTQKW